MEDFIEDVKGGDLVVFVYTNWKGATATRKAVVQSFHFGVTKHHDETGFFMRAYDMDKLEERDFAIKDIQTLRVIKNWRNY